MLQNYTVKQNWVAISGVKAITNQGVNPIDIQPLNSKLRAGATQRVVPTRDVQVRLSPRQDGANPLPVRILVEVED